MHSEYSTFKQQENGLLHATGLFDSLNTEFHFALDAAATREIRNQVCPWTAALHR